MKAGGAVGALVLAGLALLALVQRKPTAPPPTESPVVGGGLFSLRIVRVQQGLVGLLRPGWSNAPSMSQGVLALEEGQTYQVQATVTNGSTRAGVPVAASFVVKLVSNVSGLTPFLSEERRLDLTPSESRTLSSSSFTIPVLTSELPGDITGTLSPLGGAQIASASAPVTLKLAATTITGTISVTPPPSVPTAPTNPSMVSPAPGAVLPVTGATFTLDRGNRTLYRIDLSVGREPGTSTFVTAGVTPTGIVATFPPNLTFPNGGTMTYTGSSVPVDLLGPAGMAIWASLWWQEVSGGAWSRADFGPYTRA